MIKINDSWIDEDEIISLHKEHRYIDKDNKEYDIRIHTKNNSYYPINFYSNLQLRDTEFDKLGELLTKKGKKQDDNKDYIQGFKDGTEYAMKSFKRYIDQPNYESMAGFFNSNIR